MEWLEFAAKHPHEFTIQYPPRREYFMDNFRAKPVNDLFRHEKDVALYAHVPFCAAKCYYCNFAVDTRAGKIFEKYTDALCTELDQHSYLLDNNTIISGIDIGGGTPALLPIDLLVKILGKLAPFKEKSSHPFPTSIETTPLIASDEPEKMHAMHERGVDRISMGVQSFNVTQLENVNRKLQIEKNYRAAEEIRAAGFKRFNVDLIFGLPNQTLEDWKYDLEKIMELRPDSITTYDCLYRGKARVLTKKVNFFPTPAQYGEMYDLAFSILTSNGFHADYGSVNFSKFPEETGTSAYFEARLLEGKAYLGVGNYSSSLVGNTWFFNVYRADDYIKKIENSESPVGDFYRLPDEEMYAKYLLFSLNYGVIDTKKFQQRFGKNVNEIFEKELEVVNNKGWMKQQQGVWKLQPGNFRNIHAVRSLFYSEKAKLWMQNLNDATFLKISLL